MNAFPGQFFLWLVRASWQASVIALIVLAAQQVLRKRLTAQWQYALWLLVVLRLALPVAIPSKMSLFNCGRGLGAFPSHSIASQPLPPSPSAVMENAPPPPLAFSQPAAKPAWWRRHSAGLIFSLWLWGAVVFAARLFGQNWLFLRRLGTPAPVTDQDSLALLDKCRKELGLRAKVRLAETSVVKSPALCGLWRPTLLLPAGLTERFRADELRHVFLHEMAHVKRGDAFVLWLAVVLRAMHWFNPVLWLAFRRMAADREMACDELALFHAGEQEKTSYGQTILKLLELCACATPPPLVGILEDSAQMRRRIVMISRFRKRPLWPLPAGLLLLGLGIATLTDAQPKAQTSNSPPVPSLKSEERVEWLSNERMASEELREWAHDEVMAAADYAIYSNILAKLLSIPRENLGAELATAYPQHNDPQLAELSMRLAGAKDRMAQAKNEWSENHPSYKINKELLANAQRDYDAKVDSILNGIKARVIEDAANLEIIQSREAAIKRDYPRTKAWLSNEQLVSSEALREWAHDEVMAAADYAIYSNILAKLNLIPREILGAELATAYPQHNDPELAELSVRLAAAKDRMAQAKYAWGENEPAYKINKELLANAQHDYDAKVDSVLNGIKVRVAEDAANIDIIRSHEAAIKKDFARAKTAEAAGGMNTASDFLAAAAVKSAALLTEPSFKAKEIPLVTKVFRVNVRALLQRVDTLNSTAVDSAGHISLKDFFASAGVDWTNPGKSVFCSERAGLLNVRATQQDLDIIAQVLEEFQPPNRKVVIEAEFAELPVTEAPGLGFDFPADRIQDAKTTSITLWPRQHQDLIGRIKKRTGVLAMAKVSVESGAPTRVGDFDHPLSIIATAEPDGFSIWLRVLSTQAGQQSLSGHSMIWDGQTFLLLRRNTPQQAARPTVQAVFITPRLIDAAGNQWNVDEEVYKNAQRFSSLEKAN